MEHEEEFEKLFRRGTDYDELLRMGQVSAVVDDVEAWRAEIRAKVRADKLHVRTFVADAKGVVFAVLIHERTEQENFEVVKEAFAQMAVAREAFDRARLYGHRITRIARREGTRAAARCPDCGARVYIDTATTPPIIEGEAFETECPEPS